MSLLTDNKTLNRYLLATYVGLLSLLLLLLVKYINDSENSWQLLILQTLPLLIVIPGILNKYYRSHSWLCFIILAYFTAYVVETGSPLADASDWIGLTLSIVIFIGAMMSSRGLQRL